MKYIKEKIINCVHLTEIDIDLNEELLGKNWGDVDYDFIPDENSDKYYWKEGDYLDITKLVTELGNLSRMGATHVQIYPHCDHHGYYITGVKFIVLDANDAKEFFNKIKEQKLNKISNEINRYEEILIELKLKHETISNQLNEKQ